MNKEKLRSSNAKNILFSLTLVLCLIITVFGVTYSFFAASASNNSAISGNTASVGLDLNIRLISTRTSNNLVPLDNDVNSLTTAAKGYSNSGNTFDANLACVDKKGYSSCQIYQIDVTNTGNVNLNISGGVTSLNGNYSPNLACAVMASSTSVTSNASCIGSSTIVSNVGIDASETKTYYILVYINNLNSPQTDNGSFSGTVEFFANDGRISANFSS